MDATEAILTSLWTTLRADALLDDAAGGVRLYHKPPRDIQWPYLTHKLDTLTSLDNGVKPATYTIHVWDYGPNTDRVWAVRENLMRLLDLSRHTVTGQGIARFWHASEAWMPDEDPNVTHLVMIFECRYARASEIASIQAQKGT